MIKKLYIASLLCISVSTADARKIRPTPVFEIETVAAETHAKLTAEHIWSTGDWTFEDFRQKTPKTTSGRLTDDQLRALRAELSRAPWQHTYSRPPCARPVTETRYSVDGKVVYGEPGCGDTLDDVSQNVLAYAKGFVAGAIGVPGSTGPTCEAVGAPLIQLANKTETLAVFRSGAETRSTGGTQCLPPDAVSRITADLAAAAWKQTPVVHCMIATTDQTTVTVNGKVVFVERICNPFKLDDASAKSLADIEQLVGWAPAPPPPPPSCQVAGAPLVELADNATRLAIYKTGAVTNSPNNNSKRMTTKTCIAQDVVEKIAADLAAATWKQTPVVHCMIATTDQTTITINGKVVFVERVCNPYKLDDASARSLADIEKLVGWGPSTTPPPPPPACEVSGAPIVELASNATKIAVYRSGAVMNSPNDGSKRMTTKTCIAQDVVDKIAADLAAATWKQTPVTHCMMMTNDQTTISINGKVVFTERVCNPYKLDDASARSLADIEKLLNWVQPPASGASK